MNFYLNAYLYNCKFSYQGKEVFVTISPQNPFVLQLSIIGSGTQTLYIFIY